MKIRRLLWAVLIIVIAGAPLISYLLFPEDWIPSFYRWVQSQGIIGVFIFALIYVSICVFLLAPGELMAVAAGFLFGAWGAPLAVASAFSAAVIAFLISRHFVRARVKAWSSKRPLLAAIDAAVAEESWVLVILLRLNPLAPPNFQNYFFGATNIGLGPYSIASFFGIIPLTIIFVYLGSVGKSLMFEEGFTPHKLALLCVGLIASAAVVYIMTKKVGQKLRDLSATPEAMELGRS